MDIAQILDEFCNYKKLPIEAIRAAEADRSTAVPAFVKTIEDFLAARPKERTKPSPLLCIFHLLGHWRETSAYRPLIRFLRCSPEDVDGILGDVITEYLGRIIASVFDGDPQPLYELILDTQANQYVRSQGCDALAIAVLNGKLPREEAARFLASCFSDLQPQTDCYVWCGWQRAIAALGLAELREKVREAYDRPVLDPVFMRFDDFEGDLAETIEQPKAPPWFNFSLLSGPVEELSRWYSFRRRNGDGPLAELRNPQRAFNPNRNVGRNDPCPCGSGKKFKKCCLDKQQPAIFDERAA